MWLLECNMRAVFLFLIGVLLGACARPAEPRVPEPTRVNIAQDLVSKTVALAQVTEDGKARPFCSGVWVRKAVILTAAHCVDDLLIGDAVTYVVRDDVYVPGGPQRAPVVKPRLAKVMMFGPQYDLALLRALDPPTHQTAAISADLINQGQFAQVMGHSLGLWWTYSSGAISAVRDLDLEETGNDTTWIQASVPISPGNSGGGLFDEIGNLIGIADASFASPRAQLLNLFVHRDYIRDFVATFAGREA